VDDGTDKEKETAADLFARDKIIDKDKYRNLLIGMTIVLKQLSNLQNHKK